MLHSKYCGPLIIASTAPEYVFCFDVSKQKFDWRSFFVRKQRQRWFCFLGDCLDVLFFCVTAHSMNRLRFLRNKSGSAEKIRLARQSINLCVSGGRSKLPILTFHADIFRLEKSSLVVICLGHKGVQTFPPNQTYRFYLHCSLDCASIIYF